MRLEPSLTKVPVLALSVHLTKRRRWEAPLVLQLFVMLASTCLEAAVFNVQPEPSLHRDRRVVPPVRLVPFLAVAQRPALSVPPD